MDHRFDGPRYTVGVEEELMILDANTLDLANAIDTLLAQPPAEGRVQPELLESVLEITTDPCPDVEAVGGQLRRLRATVAATAAEHGLLIGSAGTHPFARWERQRVVSSARYRELVRLLGFVARQELVFGMHVHIGMADPDEAVYVANGMRAHVPLLVALSANSPLWRGQPTGLMSSRVPIFRAFPRVGIPPRFRDWDDWQTRVQFMMDRGLIEDYTYLWYDVRVHPRLGTVEIRAMDCQTRVEHTVALTALVQALVKCLVENYQQGHPLPDHRWEILDENKWLAARHGMDAELVDLDSGERRSVRATVSSMLDDLAGHAQELGCSQELAWIGDLLEFGNGAHRQLLVYEANQDLAELIREIVANTSGESQ